jgi:hypothetical protein
VDPLTDDLVDDSRGLRRRVVRAACLLHVAREDLPVVLRNLAGADAAGGGAGDVAQGGRRRGVVVHGHVAGAARFDYWREAPLRAVLSEPGGRCGARARDREQRAGVDDVTRAVRF